MCEEEREKTELRYTEKRGLGNKEVPWGYFVKVNASLKTKARKAPKREDCMSYINEENKGNFIS